MVDTAQNKHRSTTIRGLIVLTLGISIIWGGFSFWMQFLHRPGPLAAPVTLVLETGISTARIGQLLEENGVVRSGRGFVLAARLSLADRIFKAGEYTFEEKISVRGVIKKLSGGDVLQRQITIPEGLRFEEIKALLLAAEGLKGPPLAFEEGALLPETYHYRWDDKRTDLMRRMATAMTEAVTTAWEHRAEDLPLTTPQELLTLASIIEKETSREEERAMVAGVFVNRLKAGMRLQSDPTVIYGATDLTDRLRKKHLKEAHPYNTYVHKGLPPTPICNPGKASIFAAANPAQTSALFFVADGTGGHVFANTYEEHRKNVAALLALGKR